jgi:hypothetical protein
MYWFRALLPHETKRVPRRTVRSAKNGKWSTSLVEAKQNAIPTVTATSEFTSGFVRAQ